jgi:hypothetical protein
LLTGQNWAEKGGRYWLTGGSKDAQTQTRTLARGSSLKKLGTDFFSAYREEIPKEDPGK